MWNLINSYYNDLQYGHAGLMRANQPWSGYYEVSPPIWAAGKSISISPIVLKVYVFFCSVQYLMGVFRWILDCRIIELVWNHL
jgi:hypothetical protein